MLLVFLNIVFVIMAVVLNEIEFCSDLNSQWVCMPQLQHRAS
jgi:hypothetical protein